MNQIVFYLNLPKYLSDWLKFHLGDPVVFPACSPQNSVIRTFIRQPPEDYVPELPTDFNTAVVIPGSAAKPPERFFYITQKGKEAVAETCKDLFLRALWNDITPLLEAPVGLNALINAWCESNGIDLDRAETVRQCYYRIRREFSQKGINLKSFSRKK